MTAKRNVDNYQASGVDKSNTQAQANFDSTTTAISTIGSYAFDFTGYGAAIDFGGLILAGIDTYCASNACKA
jgi:hypothetical protein